MAGLPIPLKLNLPPAMDLTEYMKGGEIVMALWFGFIIGAGAGFVLSALFIFPPDVLNLKLVNMTIGDILRILGGLMVIPLLGGIGGKIFAWVCDNFQMNGTERDARIEKYGKWGSDRYRSHLTDNGSEVKDRRKD